ncbi:hypothetical protein [Novipirellula galeiformis]|nr:hypothetical protein [Novipirellula galeiformis]
MVAWSGWSVEHRATAYQDRSIVVDCDFAKFRQIMVRKNATAAIVEHSGMTLLDERIQDVALDTSGDDRPLLNAIRGVSKTDVAAVKQLTVQLDDPTLEASELVLRQNVDIQQDSFHVTTVSEGPAGRLENYKTTLDAVPNEAEAGTTEAVAGGTRIKLTVEMTVRVKVPRLFRHRADAGVQDAADDAIQGQADAIEQFIARYADDAFILPELNR